MGRHIVMTGIDISTEQFDDENPLFLKPEMTYVLACQQRMYMRHHLIGKIHYLSPVLVGIKLTQILIFMNRSSGWQQLG